MARLVWEQAYNFDKKGLRGCNVEVLPFLRFFPPESRGGWGRGWIIHFGWLYWTIMIFQYPDR